MKIAIYTIALNEENFVERWYTANKDADYLVIADTGSTDKTVEIARKLGILVHEIRVKPWRFDDARNAAMALIPADADVCVSVDMDEVLYPGWRKALEEQWGDANHGRFLYTWNHLEDGSNGLTFWYEKIHARHGYRWKHPVHEILQPDRIEEKWSDIKGFELHHFADPQKSRGQYLDLLALSVKEDPHNDRNAFYYARELMFYNRNAEAAKEFQRHLSLPSAVWRPERAAGMRFLAKVDEPENAEAWLMMATQECPGDREPWIELAQYYYRTSQWEQSLRAAERSLSITVRDYNYLSEAWAWGTEPYDLAAIASYRLGEKEKAVEYGEKALELSPEDNRLVSNLVWYRQ
jgi:glycosyltransferase involved in cell wall biosynthesis